MQEPDCSPSNASLLTALVARNAVAFPAGFAYGHLRGKAVAMLDMGGACARSTLKDYKTYNKALCSILCRMVCVAGLRINGCC